ncbi:MAG: pantoate--beta-alanine ligase [Phycisphaera sp.]|nr:pantoate--beta-alanine ligase [Phycisphaera sp.]
MLVTHNVADTRAARAGLTGSVACVPTMGALHDGHMSLVRRAAELADHVAVTIFVNPTQFGPNEDLARYPRPIERDLELCRAAGVGLVFNPTVTDVYPPHELDVTVDVPALTTILEGAHRPGHFVGVCRVVAKLLSIIQPDVACFGRKDYQQLKVIEAMVAGLCLPVRVEACDTIREPDGLAMSSRNVYLDDDARLRGLSIYRALSDAKLAADDDGMTPSMIESAMRDTLAAAGMDIDYAVVRHVDTLAELAQLDSPAVALIAARVGGVRLIDNMVVGP